MNKTIAGLALLVVSSVVSAEGFYWGASINSTDTEITEADFQATAITGRIGKSLTPNFSLEARVGFGLDDDTHKLRDSSTEVLEETLKVDNFISLLAIGKLPISDKLEIYGLAGLSRVDISFDSDFIETINGVDIETDSSSSSENDTSRTLGLGVNFGLSEDTQLNLEYTSLFDKDSVEISTISLGLTRNF